MERFNQKAATRTIPSANRVLTTPGPCREAPLASAYQVYLRVMAKAAKKVHPNKFSVWEKRLALYVPRKLMLQYEQAGQSFAKGTRLDIRRLLVSDAKGTVATSPQQKSEGSGTASRINRLPTSGGHQI